MRSSKVAALVLIVGATSSISVSLARAASPHFPQERALVQGPCVHNCYADRSFMEFRREKGVFKIISPVRAFSAGSAFGGAGCVDPSLIMHTVL